MKTQGGTDMIDTTHFKGAQKYWHNGQIHDWDSQLIHVMSHALHYGSSVFEGIRAYNTNRGPAIFRLKDHVDRLFNSASVINMDVPFTKDEIFEACKTIIRENNLNNAYIRPNLFFGYGNLGLTPRACPAETTIGCWEWGAYLGEEGITKGVHVLLLPNKRMHHSQINPSAKIGGIYVQSNINAKHARVHGFDEGLFMNLENRIAEGPGENLLIVKNGVVKTNDRLESVLEGITRTTILELAADLGYQTEIAPITLEDLISADEAMFTGTAAEVTPLVKMTDGREADNEPSTWQEYPIGTGTPGPITKQLAKLYGEIVRGEHETYHHWLTFVNEEQSSHFGVNESVAKLESV